jgi:hypothetical protein
VLDSGHSRVLRVPLASLRTAPAGPPPAPGEPPAAAVPASPPGTPPVG